jgi:hypothetical protein
MKTDKATLLTEAVSFSGLLETVREIGPILSQYGTEERQNRRFIKARYGRLTRRRLIQIIYAFILRWI